MEQTGYEPLMVNNNYYMKLINEDGIYYLVDTVEIKTVVSRKSIQKEIDDIKKTVDELLGALLEKENLLSQMK